MQFTNKCKHANFFFFFKASEGYEEEKPYVLAEAMSIIKVNIF